MRKQIILGGVLLITAVAISLFTLSRSLAEKETGPSMDEVLSTQSTSKVLPKTQTFDLPFSSNGTDSTDAVEPSPPVVITRDPGAPVRVAEPRRTEPPERNEIGGRNQSPGDEGGSDSLEDSEQNPSQYSYGCDLDTTLYDDFDGKELDTSKWNPDYPAGEREWQHYVGDVFELEDGILKIRAEERSVRGRRFASGIITTKGIFDQRYGVFETRVKVPSGQGLWPAFWLMPTSKNYPLEIDVFEILGHEPETVYMTHHWENEAGRHEFDTESFTGEDLSKEFHVYAVRWMEDEIVWYVDGVERSRAENSIPDEPMFVLVNLAVGGEWPGYPDETTPFPSYLEVDYVRVAEINDCD